MQESASSASENNLKQLNKQFRSWVKKAEAMEERYRLQMEAVEQFIKDKPENTKRKILKEVIGFFEKANEEWKSIDQSTSLEKPADQSVKPSSKNDFEPINKQRKQVGYGCAQQPCTHITRGAIHNEFI